MEDDVCSSKRPLVGPPRLQTSLNMMDVVRVLELNICLSNRQKENSALRLRELDQLTPATSLPLPATEVALISARRFRDAQRSAIAQVSATPRTVTGRHGNYTAMTHGRRPLDHRVLAQDNVITNRSRLLLITGSKSRDKGPLTKRDSAAPVIIKPQRKPSAVKDVSFNAIVSPLTSTGPGNPQPSTSTMSLATKTGSNMKRTPIERAVRARSVTYDLRLRERWNKQQSLQELHKHMVTSSRSAVPGRCRTVSDFRPEDGAIDAVAAINAAMQPAANATNKVPADALRVPAKYLLRSPSSCSSPGHLNSAAPLMTPRRVLVRLPCVQDTINVDAPVLSDPARTNLLRQATENQTATNSTEPVTSRGPGVTAITAVNIGEVQVPDETLHQIQARVQTPGTLKTYTLKENNHSDIAREKLAIVNGHAYWGLFRDYTV